MIVALFGKSETEIRLNVLLYIDAYYRADQALAVKYGKKIPINDKATSVMIEVCSMYAAHIHARHGETPDFDSVDAALRYVIGRNVATETGTRALATQSIGEAIFIEQGEQALERAMRTSADAGMNGRDLYEIVLGLVRGVFHMLKRTSTPLLVEAQYSR